MNTHQLDTLVKAEHTAQQWLRTVADRLLTPDLEYAYRLLRAWLHSLRDQLPVRQSVGLAAELPDLLRGLYYEGWEPDSIPIKSDADSFIRHFASKARISVFEVWHGAPVVSAALHSLFPPGHLEHTFAALPSQVRALVEPVSGLPAASTGDHRAMESRAMEGSALRALVVPWPRRAEDLLSQ